MMRESTPSRVSGRQVTDQARVVNAGREGTPVLSVVNEDGTTEAGSLIDGIVRDGARRMLAAALEAEVDQMAPGS